MKSLTNSSFTGLFLIFLSLTVSAQKIDEQDLKVNVIEIKNSAGSLLKLKPVTFQYDLKKYPDLKLPADTQFGFLAADIKAEFPGLVSETAAQYPAGKNNSRIVKFDQVNHDTLIPVLVAAIKEQQEQIEILKKEMELLKEKSVQ